MPSELPEEIGFNKKKIYHVYLPASCPHAKDSLGRILIHRVTLRSWCENNYMKVPLEKNQAWRVSCKKAVCVSETERHQKG